LARVRILPFTAAFFVGRIVSYSLYALSAGQIRETSIGDAFRRSLGSPVGIVLELAMLAGLVALGRIDWERYLRRSG